MAIIYGTNLSNTLDGTEENDSIYGYGGDDTLYGYGGDDILDGGAGNDTMIGGIGNDTYYVDSSGDVVSELLDAGTDKVNAYINYTLGSNVENLSLFGSATIGYGNSLDNKIFGNSNANSLFGLGGNDVLDGGAGADTMSGGSGNDIYYVDNTGDSVLEASNSGTDKVYAYANYTLSANVENLYLCGFATTGYGNLLDNIIAVDNNFAGNGIAHTMYGYAGNDTLNGGAGSDTMYGGTGNDTYIVDNTGDIVYEALGAGFDRVNAYINNYTLGANVENLYLYGTATTGTGNALNNVIVGNSNANTLYGLAGNDTLNGGAGNDAMYGGIGNDTYYVNSAGDVLFEDAAAGVDKVKAYINYTLGNNLDNLSLYGAATTGTGNVNDNVIIGNNNANYLYGLDGNDTLNGGTGNDYMEGGNGHDTLIGGTGDDHLDGGVGCDFLDGGEGNDEMHGTLGDDTYVVDSVNDVVVEQATVNIRIDGKIVSTIYYGEDTINAYINYTLGNNVENLSLYGTASTGIGNTLANVISGNSYNNSLYGLSGDDHLYGYGGNDTLQGGDGEDYMAGGNGNDTYFINTEGDIVYEDANAGTDSIKSYINYYLNSNIENLFLYGAATEGYGNSLNNIIKGNANSNSLYGYCGNDILNGGMGIDSLTGGNGQDRFVFAESGSTNYDIIVDFSHVDDTIVLKEILDGVTDSSLEGLSFTGGVLNSGKYFEGAGYTGNNTGNQSGIYNNTTTGQIWYNPTDNSVNSGDSVLICTVGVTTAISLDNTDFLYST